MTARASILSLRRKALRKSIHFVPYAEIYNPHGNSIRAADKDSSIDIQRIPLPPTRLDIKTPAWVNTFNDGVAKAGIIALDFTPIGTVNDFRNAQSLGDYAWAVAGVIPAGKAAKKAGKFADDLRDVGKGKADDVGKQAQHSSPSGGGAQKKSETVTVYRVEGKENKRFEMDKQGCEPDRTEKHGLA